MNARPRHAYLALRQRYEPNRAALVLVAESPPASGLYFYDPAGRTTEPLFAELMRLIALAPETKDEGLRALQRRGWVLVDATYEPVNALKSAERDRVIVRDYPLLQGDLARMIPDRSAPLVLIKANVCRLLEPRLKADGFAVANAGRTIYFPSHSRQNDFRRQIGAVLRSVGAHLAPAE